MQRCLAPILALIYPLVITGAAGLTPQDAPGDASRAIRSKSSAPRASRPGPLTMTIRAVTGLQNGVYRQLEPIVVEYEVSMENGGESLIFRDADPIPLDLIIRVAWSGTPLDNHIIGDRPTAFASSEEYRKEVGKSAKDCVLRPGRPFTGRVVVNLLRDMTAMGKYTVELEATLRHPRAGDTAVIRAKSNKIEVVVQGGPL